MATTSGADISETENLSILKKKDQSQSLSFMENINCETGSYLSVQNPFFHATVR